ncbi:hypothetical protein M433DRAFT_154854 [Acidomyces richmondensis BFW]|nr:MAG: hypothetical protein FE78DRAFT_91236 [Acidomyces sp. 'richmondensis']KYG45125.1 hypothetical protein M433DRAFT_154854 [Acidomyces richmondensis BFW]
MSEPHEQQCATRPPFTIDDSLKTWDMSAKDWLVSNQKDNEWDGLATASVVFNSHGQVLIIQRASQDSMPNKWELPGGGVDDNDSTILHAAARELWEEAGLYAKRFTHVVTEGPNRGPGDVFPNSTETKVWCRFAFHVEVYSCDSVRVDPHEHQDFLWASEEEIRNQMIGSREIPITRESMKALILEAFRLRKARMQS